ncbi:MAG: bifunctional (p)ppGpp synthetase/guanosine-3',5'-bis(diphosphate) 3'-pyrophosphohydrolase [Deltaproteobacteria bacterium]|nr:MAG: bifunctional (p)ppGpp synthetase/guanosine-3',5'-bis(diphosphate) 3'-pyrophosphohydrolase [Deltaproteobacteria bacterium]
MDPQLESRFGEVVTKVRGYHPSPDIDLFRSAFEFAADRHAGQVRKSGEPYIGHPLEVAAITADLQLDLYSLCAALLHDTVEDTDTSIEEIRERFSDQVAFLVNGLTKIAKLKFQSREEQQAENIRKLIVAMGRDIRVVLVKLADRLHNIRTLEHMSAEGQRRIARETMDIYAPLANRLGISWIKGELEDQSFRYLDPEGYYELATAIQKTRAERERYIRETAGLLRDIVQQRDVKAEISGRPKHFYSIYKKMRESQIGLEQIHDLTAFRVIVDDTSTCYEVLGLVHALWRPVVGRFKDYIAVPKANGYQSLHTTAIGPNGERVEVQIRTQEMHRVAEYGVAAHWAYKEGRSVARDDGQTFKWLRQLIESQAEIHDSREFLDTVKLDLFSDEVFVFTPQGDIKSLPQGATPLDFAYSVHSEVGNRCVHARVNGRVVNLRHTLSNGDTIEIITRSDQRPREEWLDIVKSSRARQKIRQYVRQEKKEKAKDMARGILVSELKRYGLRFEAVLKSGDLDAAAQLLKLQNADQLLIALGYGTLRKEAVIERLVPPDVRPRDEAGTSGPTASVRRIGERIKSLIGKQERRGIRLAGMDGEVMVTYARCCNPVYGEEVVGFVTRGRGITVHRTDCNRIEHLEEERRIDVEWESLARGEAESTRRRVTIRVICRDEPGKLAEMSSALTSRGVNIAQAHCRTREDGLSSNTFDLMVTSIGQLSEAMKQVKRVDGVSSVERVQG